MTTTDHGTADHDAQSGYFPAGMPRQLDYTPAAVPEILLSSAKRYPDRAAFVDGDDTITFSELLARASRLAQRLAADGAGPGRVVAIQLPNTLDFPVAYFGALLTGSAVTLVNPLQPAPALARQLMDAQAHLLITHPAHLTAAIETAADLDLTRILITGVTWAGPATDEQLATAGEVVADAAQPRFTSFDSAITAPTAESPAEAPGTEPSASAEAAPSFTPVLAHSDDVAHYQFTGGTTGRSKAVRVVHRNVIDNVTQVAAWRLHSRIERDEDGDLALIPIETLGEPLLRPGVGVAIQVPPLFHAQGIASIALFALGGVTTVLTGRFRPDTFIDLCDRWQAEYTSGNPPMYLALAAHAAQTGRTAPTIRAAMSGAAPLDATSLGKITEVMPNAIVGEGYGLTEGTCVVTASDITVGGTRKPGTVGIPISDTQVEVRSADGTEVLPTGREGELWVRGPQVTAGYADAPELTAAQFVDGWLRTGDVASIDSAGFVRIHDRAKDMLLYKGYNVYPRELEDILSSHPNVAQAAVVGRPDADVGEVPIAFVVHRPDATPADDPQAGASQATASQAGTSQAGASRPESSPGDTDAQVLMDWFAGQVLPYQKVREVHFVDALPTSTAGKVLKTELRARL
ncbi:AMP-binding protein [Brevibacterium jeotgali]|uniref:Long-chain acyl-CoA synthetase n=1 Tax=Brevibacterium jeotgali TaxID=1262550 RepID=A0A2H1L3V7_9MICO|nr:AMP-binding protein [Brevibacterium jeotgali]TWC01841.1 long-chain acyl-CoA synthetase [Brevibacterium jeotgali]SMY11588.1 long-chain acyl-CoA synthetase [Brevibacterium jeotgali]